MEDLEEDIEKEYINFMFRHGARGAPKFFGERESNRTAEAIYSQSFAQETPTSWTSSTTDPAEAIRSPVECIV